MGNKRTEWLSVAHLSRCLNKNCRGSGSRSLKINIRFCLSNYTCDPNIHAVAATFFSTELKVFPFFDLVAFVLDPK